MANFSEISEKEQLCVDDVVQSAVVEIHERGIGQPRRVHKAGIVEGTTFAHTNSKIYQ